MEEDLECFYCMQVVVKPYGCNQCGILVCKSEVVNFKDGKCHQCNTGYFEVNNWAEKLIRHTEVVCDKGCEQYVNVLDLPEHKLSCEGVPSPTVAKKTEPIISPVYELKERSQIKIKVTIPIEILEINGGQDLTF